MSTRVLETIDHHHRDLVHARLLQHELGQVLCLRDARVAADLAVVGGLAAEVAHRVEQRQRAAARADHEAQVAVELGHVAGHAAVVDRVDPLALDLERRGLARLACLVLADAELLEQLLLAATRLVLHLHVRVECNEAAIGQLDQRVDLGQRHVVLHEQPREPGEERRQAVQPRAGDADGGDDLLRLEVGLGEQRRDVPAPDVVGVLLGHLLDVDAADVGEDEGRELANAVPDHAGVVLLLDLGLRADQQSARHVAVDLEFQDLARLALGLLGRVGEADAAGLHAAAGQHLRLDDDGTADFPGDPLDVLDRLGEAAGRDRDPLALQDLA